MKTMFLLTSGVIYLTFTSVGSAAVSPDALHNWAQWRGPLANGTAPDANPPLEWNESKNVKWKAKIPGEGTATPIVWGDRVFILTAVGPEKKAEAKPAEAKAPEGKTPEAKAGGPAGGPPGEGGRKRPGGPGGGFGQGGKPTEKYQFTVLCLDRKTGKTLWQKVARDEVPHEGRQQNNSFASASPITDGKVLLAHFGSRGLHCYDLDGNPKWSKDFGKMQTRMGFGEGASATLYEDKVIVYWDDETDGDYITALDKITGKELWKTPRNEATGWSTPLVVEHDKKLQVVVNATGKVRSYDFANGAELWSVSGQTANAIPTPVADGDTVYVTSGFRGAALYAIQLGRGGDLTGTDAIRWTHNKATPYVPSPLLVDGMIYVVSGNNGVLSCIDAKTGNANFEGERLEGVFEIYASPVAAKDRVYVLSRDGKCLVLKKGSKLEILATNKLDDKTDASIALVGKELFIRGKDSLYCIAQ
jgi:outer membrane protein assembly factor BamB